MNAVSDSSHLPLMGSNSGFVETGSGKVLWGGYPVERVTGGVEEKFCCTDCSGVLRTAVQTQCGYRLCNDCWSYRTVKVAPQEKNRLCKRCLEEDVIPTNDNIKLCSDIFPDNFVRRQVDSILVGCPFTDCNWRGSVRELNVEHEAKHLKPSLYNSCRSVIRNSLSSDKETLSSQCDSLQLPRLLKLYLSAEMVWEPIV